MESRLLGTTGVEVSVLGFGTAPLGGEYGAFEEAAAFRTIHAAIDAGVTFFDSSPYYGRTLSEERLGRALEGRRDRVFLATKCGRYDVDGFDFSAARVESSIDESLARLRTDRLDLYQLHDIEFWDKQRIVEEALPALLRVKESGKARFVGITGLPIHYLCDVAAAAPIDTILSYCHLNLMIDDLETHVLPLAQDRGIGVINASPLHMGILTDAGPPDWHPAPEEVKESGRRAARLCREAGTTLPKAALRWAIERPGPATTVCGMLGEAELEENLTALDVPVDSELLSSLEAALAPVHGQTWIQGRDVNNP